MLKGIDPLLSPEALQALRAMGHGDDLIIADSNFPADSVARSTVFGRPIRMDCGIVRAVQAVLSVMPIDTFVTDAVARMEVVGAPDQIMPVQAEVMQLLEGTEFQMIGIERYAFYERAKQAYAVIWTQERRPYADFAIRKGVLGPEEILPNS